MKELNQKQIRSIQIEILKKTAEFCEKNKISYFLCGGTLLGAVRHQGYIPWDDDIDLMMIRSDFERFKKEFEIPGYSLNDFESKGKDFTVPFVKIQKDGTLLQESKIPGMKTGINIDIFPIDGFPNDSEERKLHLNKLAKLIETIKLNNQIFSYQKYPVFWKSLLISLLFVFRKIIAGFSSTLRSCEQLDRLAKKYDFKTADLAGIAVWGYGSKEVCPKEVFIEQIELKFEDRMYAAPKDYHTYLSLVYGDYMELPPMEERKRNHPYNAYLIS